MSLDHTDMSPENAALVHAAYARKPVNRPLMRSLCLASDMIFNAGIHFEDGAEDIYKSHLERGGQVYWAGNHQAFWDPLYHAKMVRAVRMFRSMRFNTVIPGAAKYFNDPKFGWVIRGSGVAVPMQRDVDIPATDDIAEHERLTNARHDYADASLGIIVDRLNQGWHADIFPEGSRNLPKSKDQQRRDVHKLVTPLYKGMARSILAADNPANIKIGCIAIAYQGKQHDDYRHAQMVLTRPIEVPDMAPAGIMGYVAEDLQRGMDKAFALL